jgi:hypothetical protein
LQGGQQGLRRNRRNRRCQMERGDIFVKKKLFAGHTVTVQGGGSGPVPPPPPHLRMILSYACTLDSFQTYTQRPDVASTQQVARKQHASPMPMHDHLVDRQLCCTDATSVARMQQKHHARSVPTGDRRADVSTVSSIHEI